tara:strand:- start:1391 stop:1660 length:270 start_codon:yes stop_codon:yes gene_type:complete
MKKYNGFITVAVSIIIAAIIISIPIYNKSISSLDHCYKKVYKNELNKELIRNEKINKKLLDLGEPKSPYFTKEKAEADAAEEARRQCIK